MDVVESLRWRQAAESLGLALVDADGRTIDGAFATCAHAMRGVLASRQVRVTSGRGSDGIIRVAVRLNRPLLLGLRAQASAPPKAANGRRLGRTLRTAIDGVDRARVSELLETHAGSEVWARIRRLGALGWAELTDTRLRTQSEAYAEQAGGYVAHVRHVVDTAVLAEAARDALAPAAWELTLRKNLEDAAEALVLALNRERFALTGTASGYATSLELDVSTRYALRCGVVFPTPLPPGSAIAPRRASWWSRIAFALGLARGVGDGRFDAAFVARGKLRQRLSRGVVDDLVRLADGGELTVDERAIRCRTPMDADATGTLRRMLALADGLGGGGTPRGPYR